MKISKKYWNIAKRLTTAQLQKGSYNEALINEADLFSTNIGKRGHQFFLGYYSLEGLMLAFEKYGIIAALRKIGFSDIHYELDTSDPYVHRLSLFHQAKSPKNLLIEVVLKRHPIKIDMPFETRLNGKKYDTLGIEWMCMQNPYADFTKKRPQLPGQKFPGLGLASKAVELLLITAWRLGLAGLVNIPEHYHNAYLYSRIFYYLQPTDQARLKALIRDMKKFSLHTIAWAIEYRAVRDVMRDEPLKWVVAKQIVPLDDQLKKMFNSRDYAAAVEREMLNYRFELDMEKYKRQHKAKGE